MGANLSKALGTIPRVLQLRSGLTYILCSQNIRKQGGM